MLEMTFQTKCLITLFQHPRIDRAMNGVTGRATFSNRLVLENKWASLCGMASSASVKFGRQRRAAAFDHLPFVRIMAIRATNLPFQNWVMGWQIEFAAFIEVALETSLGRFPRIDDRIVRASRFIVEAPRSVARFATDIGCILTFRLQACVGRRAKPLGDILVALGTGIRADKLCAWNIRWRDHHGGHAHAGDQYRRGQHAAQDQKPFGRMGLRWLISIFRF